MISRYHIPIFPISIFQSPVRDNRRIQELVYPMIKKSSGKHDVPPEGWLTNKLITSFEDDDFNDNLLSDEGIGKEIKDQYLDSTKIFNELNIKSLFSFESGIDKTIDWYKDYFLK